jgi:hypothetical protein
MPVLLPCSRQQQFLRGIVDRQAGDVGSEQEVAVVVADAGEAHTDRCLRDGKHGAAQVDDRCFTVGVAVVVDDPLRDRGARKDQQLAVQLPQVRLDHRGARDLARIVRVERNHDCRSCSDRDQYKCKSMIVR